MKIALMINFILMAWVLVIGLVAAANKNRK